MNVIESIWISCINSPLMAGALVFGGAAVLVTAYTYLQDFGMRP
jgi:hypothetical protein